MTNFILTKPPEKQKLTEIVQRQAAWLRAEIVCRLVLGLDTSRVTPLLLECLDYLDSVRVNGEGANNGTDN